MTDGARFEGRRPRVSRATIYRRRALGVIGGLTVLFGASEASGATNFSGLRSDQSTVTYHEIGLSDMTIQRLACSGNQKVMIQNGDTVGHIAAREVRYDEGLPPKGLSNEAVALAIAERLGSSIIPQAGEVLDDIPDRCVALK